MKHPTDILQKFWVRILILALMAMITISLHYKGMSQQDIVIRGLFRQFCYLPILVAALWFGLRGGVLAAGIIVVSVAPNLIFRQMSGPLLALEILEYLYYFLFGGVFGYLSDREREAQRKREKLVQRIERMEHLSAIGELAAGLAHEIKNPMGSIKGAAEILAPEIAREHPKREFVNILIEEVNRLNSVVEDFLRYSRPLELSRSRFALLSALEGVTRQMALYEQNRGIDYSLEVPAGMTVFGDEEKLGQVFMNVVLNACQAMNGAGRLRITAGRDRANGEIRVEFHDSGPGVPEPMRRRIFMPFHTSKPSGTGLGLTMSERIVSAHGGRIEVKDSPEGGAAFVIVLPEED